MSTQISAYISDETKVQIEAFVRNRGVTKGYLIEQALQHHLMALHEIPEDLVVPARLVISSESMEHVLESLASNEPPTEALRNLMRSHED